MDADLEYYLKWMSAKIIKMEEKYDSREGCLLFWDGFGANTRGLAQIYLKALCRCRHVIYVTYADRVKQIPKLLEILDQTGGEHFFIKRSNKINEVRQLNELMKRHCPQHFFYYSVPDDVTATSVMYAYEGMVERYQINLTDHAFWIGAGCIDKCIEFREYGACISAEHRMLDKNKIVCIPYYPLYGKEDKFEGYPFPFDESRQRLVFSGGNLYNRRRK